MYKQYYGLQRNPFDLAPNRNMVFFSTSHQEALAVLKYAVMTRKGFLVLTGDAGTGKTTMLHALLASFRGRAHVCLLNNPSLTRFEFYYFLANRLKLAFNNNKALFLEQFSRLLNHCRQKKERVLLIIDEAHVMPVEIMEEIRLLSNLDGLQGNVLSIFFVGQPELNERMRDPRLLPLRQRIRMRFHLQHFSTEETEQYIIFRLRCSGARHLNIFTEKALILVHEVSKGIPRLINIVCDYALLTGFSAGRPVIDENIIHECVRELHFPGEHTPLPVGVVKRRRRWESWPAKNVSLAILWLMVMVVVVIVVYSPTDSPAFFSGFFGEEWLRRLHDLFGKYGG